MTQGFTEQQAGGDRSRLFVYNGGFLTQRRIRRILDLAGFDIRLGLPGPDDLVGIWGNSPTAHRGIAVSERRNVPLVRVEDAFLRSLRPGRAGEPPAGLLIDRTGVHFDPARPSDLETLLLKNPLDDAVLLTRARDAIARLRHTHLSKYNAFDPARQAPDPGYVLVIDQTRGDASVAASNADRARFREMLVFAQEENPGARVLIRTHPETRDGHRTGHFTAEDLGDRVSFCDGQISPWHVLEGAIAVYTVSSQMGFEAILAGHKPRVFGQPFYASWGLTQDEAPLPRRNRNLTRAQLFVGAMMLYPTWYDPFRDELCELETVLDTLEAETTAWRHDRNGWTAGGMRLWKRAHINRFFGSEQRVRFADTPPDPPKRPHMAWASGPSVAKLKEPFTRVEDGFLRSRGLGASLVPPLSLVTDTKGIYYDPTRPSQLEDLIAASEHLRNDQHRRAEALIAALVRFGLSKYNLVGHNPTLPEGHRVLVPGQVEDDASIRTGAGAVRTNLALLEAARSARPNACIIYKPHPDVEAGLRAGAVPTDIPANVIATGADPAALLDQVDEVWTMTSLTGFEALLRNLPVTTLGAPFYAGWGLTTDFGPVPNRRSARPGLAGLVHATLIDYPRYRDPITGQPCPVEVIVERLASGRIPRPGPFNRILSKAQGLLASHASLWR